MECSSGARPGQSNLVIPTAAVQVRPDRPSPHLISSDLKLSAQRRTPGKRQTELVTITDL